VPITGKPAPKTSNAWNFFAKNFQSLELILCEAPGTAEKMSGRLEILQSMKNVGCWGERSMSEKGLERRTHSENRAGRAAPKHCIGV
ncbi:MAG TPA: hypothetical protein PLT67_10745, partial [Kiritimatiellia bacterium]|nr:hypothetical protein [Kiritimatiellia bacterium]HQQ05296.1 hypothetical protein [Kiritimatiellia bacterium]